jgi:flagellin
LGTQEAERLTEKGSKGFEPNNQNTEVKMIIQNNNLAQKAYVPYRNNINTLARSAARLSTGRKYASAADGTGDLGVAHKMRLNHKGTAALSSGMQNAKSLSDSQDEILQQVEDVITRMQELAASAVDPTKNASDRTALENEFRALSTEVAGVAATARYNDGLLFQTDRTVRVGLNAGETFSLSQIKLSNISFTSISVSTVATADAALLSLATRAGSLAIYRSKARAHGARLERTMSSSTDYVANLKNAESSIRDIDVAVESGEFTKAQVTVAASQAVLAQANGVTQGALAFLNFR